MGCLLNETNFDFVKPQLLLFLCSKMLKQLLPWVVLVKAVVAYPIVNRQGVGVVPSSLTASEEIACHLTALGTSFFLIFLYLYSHLPFHAL
jgi:hypothetical protein